MLIKICNISIGTNFNHFLVLSIETSSSTNKLLPIYSVQTDKKDIALTINCAW